MIENPLKLHGESSNNEGVLFFIIKHLGRGSEHEFFKAEGKG